MFWEYFFVKHGSETFTSALEAALHEAKQYRYVGEFLGAPIDQTDLLAAFGIVLADRLARTALAGGTGWESFTEIGNLFECADYVELALGGHADMVSALASNKVREGTRRAAIARHTNSPKARAKNFVRECWQTWTENPHQYASTADFARKMQDKYPDELTSQPVVERWVREWREGQD
jgi:hypothetical protein